MADEVNRMNIARRAQPVVLDPKLARMTEKAPAPRRIGGKVLLMAEEPKADTGKQKRMAPVRKAGAARAAKTRSDQLEPPPRRVTEKQPSGYVRLRLRVEDGEMSVVGAKAVEGPLVESKLQGALAYEVMLGTKRVAAGAIPDVGEKRSFPDPRGKGEMQGHHITPLTSYEVTVRVPKDQVSASALPRLEIALYRVKEELPVNRVERLAAGAMGPQFERELREVGRIKGIRPDRLAKPVRDEVTKAFR
jgi:hypothetical protein